MGEIRIKQEVEDSDDGTSGCTCSHLHMLKSMELDNCRLVEENRLLKKLRQFDEVALAKRQRKIERLNAKVASFNASTLKRLSIPDSSDAGEDRKPAKRKANAPSSEEERVACKHQKDETAAPAFEEVPSDVAYPRSLASLFDENEKAAIGASLRCDKHPLSILNECCQKKPGLTLNWAPTMRFNGNGQVHVVQLMFGGHVFESTECATVREAKRDAASHAIDAILRVAHSG